MTVHPEFDAGAVWEAIAGGELTLFMAVPTIYSRLIAAWEAAPPERQTALSVGCRTLRLMVSGSAALPVRVLERWQEISGHVLLGGRYGMTEIGMALSNPLYGRRRPGSVGAPAPRRGGPPSGSTGARPEATRAAFRGGWFRTGDIAVMEEGSYRILGWSSVDILKTGGYKVSAHPPARRALTRGGLRRSGCDSHPGERSSAGMLCRREALASGGKRKPSRFLML